jgi:phosphate starvation-inducible protein PhoH
MAPRKPEFSPATSQSATEMDNFGRARMELDFDQPFLLGPLFGDYDRHLVMIEQRLGVNISARGNRVMIDGEPDAAARAREVLLGLYDRLDKGQDVEPPRSNRSSAWPTSLRSTGSSPPTLPTRPR